MHLGQARRSLAGRRQREHARTGVGRQSPGALAIREIGRSSFNLKECFWREG